MYKTSQRRDLDISAVNSSFVFKIIDNKVADARIGFGGVAEVPLRLHALETDLIGRPITSDLVKRIHKFFDENLNPISDLRGTSDFRKLMAKELFTKYAKEHLGL